MKLTLTLALLSALVCPGAPAERATPPTTSPASATATSPAGPTVDEILEGNFAALGGKAKLRAVRSLRFRATQSSGGAAGTVVPITVSWKRPDRLRIEYQEEGLLKVQAFDGTIAWTSYPELPGFEPEVLSGAERDALRDQADLVEGPTLDYALKGNRVELVGKEEVGDGEAWRLELTSARGEHRSLWIDCRTHLQVREERAESIEGRQVLFVTRLEDFQPTGGLLFARRTQTRSRTPTEPAEGVGDAAVFTIHELALDVELADSLFSLPAAGPPQAPSQGAKPAPSGSR